jgi:hypothetical protein
MKRTIVRPLTAATVAFGLIIGASIATPAAARRGADDGQRPDDRGGRHHEGRHDKKYEKHDRSKERARADDRNGKGQGRGRGRGQGRGRGGDS